MKRCLVLASFAIATLLPVPAMATGIPVIGELALQSIAEGQPATDTAHQEIAAGQQELPSAMAVPPLDAEGYWIFDPPVTAEEDGIIRTAMHGCPISAQRHASPALMLEMLRIEEEIGIGPDHDLRAFSIATHCREAAYMIGERVCKTGSCDGGRAVGPLQLHAGYANLCLGRAYGAEADEANTSLRYDMRSSIVCYTEQIYRVMRQRMRNSCVKTALWVAEVWVARGKMPVKRHGGRDVLDCGAASSHVDLLRSWRGR